MKGVQQYEDDDMQTIGWTMRRRAPRPDRRRRDQSAGCPLKDAVEKGDATHEPALKDMKGRWKHPIAGMGWYKTAKRDFAALPDD